MKNNTNGRILDLEKKLSAQAARLEKLERELEIETALERVRSRSMAMHSSDELGDVASVLFKALIDLGISNFFNCGFIIVKEEEGEQYGWLTQPEGNFEEKLNLPYPGDSILKKRLKAWKDKVPVFHQKVGGRILDRHLKYVADRSHSQHQVETFMPLMPDPTYFYCGNFSEGYLHIITGEELGEEAEAIIARLTKVFEQSYTRFLDLQKAEAQAREAQIEAALEKIRSRSLAMHKSDELSEVTLEVHRKFKELNVSMESRVAVIVVFDEDSKNFNQWIASHDFSDMYISTPYFENQILIDFWAAKEEGVEFYSQAYSTEVKNRYFNTFFEISNMGTEIGIEEQREWVLQQQFYTYSPAFQKNSSIGLADFSGEPLTETEIKIIKRFSKVFEQAYIRFLDLQKAEEQAREAEIEVALERVRSKSLAMHHSDELQEVIFIVFNQLKQLGINMDVAFIQIFDDTKNTNMWVANPNHDYAQLVHIPYRKNALLDRVLEARKNKESFFTDSYDKRAKNNFYRHAFKHSELKSIPKKTQDQILNRKGYARSMAVTSNAALSFLNLEMEYYGDEANEILQRFTKVFDQAYTRFLDLQKAEAQAQEAEIEVSLERVRASTMAMHASDDVATATIVMFDELKKLGLHFERCGIAIPLDDQNIEFWAATSEQDGQTVRVVGQESLSLHPALQSAYTAWEKKQDYQNFVLDGKDLIAYYRSVKDTMPLPDWKKQMQTARKGREDFSTFPFTDGWVYIFRKTALEASSIKLLKRFAQVFDLTYRRYLDLQRAEAQVREAEIETALERLRAASMAMHRSDELSSTSLVMFQEIVKLGIQPWNFAFCIFRGESDVADCFASDQTGSLPPMVLPHKPDKFLRKTYEDWRSNKTLTVQEAKGGALKKHQEYMKSIPGFDQILKQRKTAGVKLLEKMIFNNAHFKYGYLMINTLEPQTDFWDILQRLAKVFEQTYTRFLDLKKSEKQARDVQIEAALERVRSTSMAMHKSEELHEVVKVLHREFKSLDVKFHVVNLYLNIHKSKDLSFWTGSGDLLFPSLIHWPYVNLKMQDDIHKSWGSNKLVNVSYEPKEKQRFLNELFKIIEIPKSLQARLRAKKGLVSIGSVRSLTGLQLVKYSYDNFTEEEQNIVLRFSKVFEQTYTRFLDLQKAEAQAREAQIETGLERVRASTMAMHQSSELAKVISLIFQEIHKLEFPVDTCTIHTPAANENEFMYWVATPEQAYAQSIIWPYFENPVIKKHKEALKDGIEFFSDHINKKETRAFYQFGFENTTLGDLINEERRERVLQVPGMHRSFSLMKNSGLQLMNFKGHAYTDHENDIIKRFNLVFEQTYTRFLDLQKAEEQAREAQIETALERIRARAMAMHRTDELSQVAVVLFQQLKQLNIQLQWCWFAIVNGEKEYTDIWYTEYEGDFNPNPSRQPFTSPEAEGFVTAWKNKDDFYKSELCGNELKEYVEILGTDPQFKDGTSHKIFMENLDGCLQQIHAFFKYGSIGYSSFHSREVDAEMILSRMASTFEIAYTRFLDLKKAEEQATIAEEQNRELARSYKELKETQSQLIQSEKMASLGELTAGIAHEIQNPLNFVNNFSEVSGELLEEMEEELTSTALSQQQLDDVKEIIGDLKQNLEKIHHHGGRADSIVKGMLQHSRTSSGEMVPTDINELADEYLRLAYHGLRAKDPTFNAAMETNFDESIGKINVIPQDIGRVLLNLITNAFQACAERSVSTSADQRVSTSADQRVSTNTNTQPLTPEGDPTHTSDSDKPNYKPKVTLTTQRLLGHRPRAARAGFSGGANLGKGDNNSTIQLSISDNGPGIPNSIKDKIFQPFFTTKPTGQGTGLGLSLAYDIIKAHGGELKLDSEVGNGTTFMIILPMNKS